MNKNYRLFLLNFSFLVAFDEAFSMQKEEESKDGHYVIQRDSSRRQDASSSSSQEDGEVVSEQCKDFIHPPATDQSANSILEHNELPCRGSGLTQHGSSGENGTSLYMSPCEAVENKGSSRGGEETEIRCKRHLYTTSGPIKGWEGYDIDTTPCQSGSSVYGSSRERDALPSFPQEFSETENRKRKGFRPTREPVPNQSADAILEHRERLDYDSALGLYYYGTKMTTPQTVRQPTNKTSTGVIWAAPK